MDRFHVLIPLHFKPTLKTHPTRALLELPDEALVRVVCHDKPPTRQDNPSPLRLKKGTWTVSWLPRTLKVSTTLLQWSRYRGSSCPARYSQPVEMSRSTVCGGKSRSCFHRGADGAFCESVIVALSLSDTFFHLPLSVQAALVKNLPEMLSQIVWSTYLLAPEIALCERPGCNILDLLNRKAVYFFNFAYCFRPNGHLGRLVIWIPLSNHLP